MQFNGKQPLGVVYVTSMDRPDAALGLALLYGFTAKRDARIGSVSVNGSGLGAAIFCDLVARFYTPGPPRNANQVLPTGLAAESPLPPDPSMVKAAVDRKNDKGEFQYPRNFSKLSDTALAEAVIRNGVIYNAEAVVVLSAPATYLARTLDLQGTKDLFKQRVKRLVIVDSGAKQDRAALSKVLDEWPTPIFFCPRETGASVPYPAASIDKDFAWSPAHPIVDAYRAFRPMPYDAPSYDLAALMYAVHPDQDFFGVETGTIQVSADGAMSFTSGTGPHKALTVDPAKKPKLIQAFVELASAKPAQPQQRPRPPQAQDSKKTP